MTQPAHVQLETRFNHRYNYPYVFLNDEPFTEEFKLAVAKQTASEVTFGLVPPEHWGYPPFVDVKQAEERMVDMEKMKVNYGGLLAYHLMCRQYDLPRPQHN